MPPRELEQNRVGRRTMLSSAGRGGGRGGARGWEGLTDAALGHSHAWGQGLISRSLWPLFT